MGNYRIRECLFCDKTFRPKSSIGSYCSWQCKFKAGISSTKPDKNGCLNYSGSINSDGYGWFRPSKFEKVIKAHRAAWILANGEIPNGMHVCHHCDNRKCVNHEHLFLGTNYDNVRDKVKKGRCADLAGIKHPRARLTEADVIAIRADNRSREELAKIYGVRAATISQIVLRVNWKHI